MHTILKGVRLVVVGIIASIFTLGTIANLFIGDSSPVWYQELLAILIAIALWALFYFWAKK